MQPRFAGKAWDSQPENGSFQESMEETFGGTNPEKGGRNTSCSIGNIFGRMREPLVFMLDLGIKQGCFAHVDMDSHHGQIMEEKFSPPSCLKAAS